MPTASAATLRPAPAVVFPGEGAGRHGFLAGSIAWSAGLVLPSAVAVCAIAVAMSNVGGEDWGFEYLLVVPVFVISLFAVAPLACWATLRRLGYQDAGKTAAWCIPISLVAVFTVFPLALVAPIIVRAVLNQRAQRATALATSWR